MRVVPGGIVEWHSTGHREELLLVLSGTLSLETRASARRSLTRRISGGQAVYLPRGVMHRVHNRSQRPLRYIYVTA